MFALLWESRDDLFAFDAAEVVEVIPMVEWRVVATLPPWVRGLANHHGTLIPILDAAVLVGHEAVEPRFATRIVVLRVHALGEDRLVGLLVPKVVGIESIDASAAGSHRGFAVEGSEHLGEVIPHGNRSVQRVVATRLLQGARAEVLFRGTAAAVAAVAPSSGS